ncbi:hypothetical protein [Burkholderia contaminans]|uniref:hypothetical protein n=1 Tax=Burkholderia contaminans TaxID=488447 RepID=UPI002D7FDFF6|nr:hypothetical protein [Burkholderia contaminans]
MKFLLLTRAEDDSKQLVNMELVSEAISVSGEGTYTNLVVPSAVDAADRMIGVCETPEQIAALLRAAQA